MATEYLGGEVPKIAGFLNELLGMDRNYGGYRPIYPEGAKDYEIAAGEVQPIDYVRQEYGADPGQMGPDQEELAAQAGGPVADNRYETPATPQAIDDGLMDIWPEGIPSTTVTPTATANGSGQVTIENENRINEMMSDLGQGGDIRLAEDLPFMNAIGGGDIPPEALNLLEPHNPIVPEYTGPYTQDPNNLPMFVGNEASFNDVPGPIGPQPQPGNQEVYTKPVSTPELEMAGAIAQMGGQPTPPAQPPALAAASATGPAPNPMSPEFGGPPTATAPSIQDIADLRGGIPAASGGRNASQGEGFNLINAISNWFSGNKGRTMTPPMATTGDIRNRPMSIGASSSAPQFTAQGHRMAGWGGNNTGPAGDSARHTYQPKFTPA